MIRARVPEVSPMTSGVDPALEEEGRGPAFGLAAGAVALGVVGLDDGDRLRAAGCACWPWAPPPRAARDAGIRGPHSEIEQGPGILIDANQDRPVGAPDRPRTRVARA
jgi:hypothetical protein